jgi:hypothetical protein
MLNRYCPDELWNGVDDSRRRRSPEGRANPVRVIEVFVEELDLGELGFGGVDPEATGRPSYHPSVLLKLYIYGYLNRVQSSHVAVTVAVVLGRLDQPRARSARHRIPLDPGKSRGSSMRVVLWVPTVDDFPCFFPETGRFSKKNREAIEHERAITERD